MLNGLNILPSYTDYFHLNAATTGLNTASVFIGGFFGPLVSGTRTARSSDVGGLWQVLVLTVAQVSLPTVLAVVQQSSGVLY